MSAELAEIAAAVAKALELEIVEDFGWGMEKRGSNWFGPKLHKDGSNVFDPYWFQRCVLWLLKNEYNVAFARKASGQHLVYPYASNAWRFTSSCPAAEFPARAIDALMKDQP